MGGDLHSKKDEEGEVADESCVDRIIYVDNCSGARFYVKRVRVRREHKLNGNTQLPWETQRPSRSMRTKRRSRLTRGLSIRSLSSMLREK